MQKTAKRKEESIAIKNRWSGDIIFQSTKTTWKEAVEEAVENCADLRYADLRDADLCDADLYKANLYKANLHEADLYLADLRHANLSDTFEPLRS